MAAGLALAGWWAVSLHGVRSRKQEKELPDVELPGHLHEVVSGVSPALVIFYVFMFVFVVGYVLFIWLGGIGY
jgi:hypothetical protein